MHAKWLCQGCPHDEGKTLCECKYCGDNVKQSDISHRWSNFNPNTQKQKMLQKGKKDSGKENYKQAKGESGTIGFKDYTVLRLLSENQVEYSALMKYASDADQKFYTSGVRETFQEALHERFDT